MQATNELLLGLVMLGAIALPLTSSRASTCSIDSGVNYVQVLGSFLYPDKVLDLKGMKVTAKADCVVQFCVPVENQ